MNLYRHQSHSKSQNINVIYIPYLTLSFRIWTYTIGIFVYKDYTLHLYEATNKGLTRFNFRQLVLSKANYCNLL